MERYDVLIAGAGHGGAQAAIQLRQLGFAGSIALAGDELELPYERPPLSKDYLAGEKAFERMLIRPAAFWRERDVAMLTGRKVSAVNPSTRTVSLSGGGIIAYGALVWAAGGTPRRLTCPGAGLDGVHVLRSKADAEAIRAALPRAHNVAVIGGGYIGLEAAAVLRAMGKAVTVLEAKPRLLSRVAGAPVSDFYAAEHRARGVDVRTGVSVVALTGEGSVAGVRLSDGETIPADFVIAGIGIAPAAGPLLAAGAEGGDGMHVDEFCRTSLPDVYAIGDCAAHESRFAGGERVRIESVQNATDQAAVAAKAIAGSPEPYAAIPWFWSNQYDLRLQTVGLSAGHDDLVLRGDPAARSFSVLYLKRGRVIALDCVNSVKDYVQGRKLILDGAVVPKARLADAGAPLKELTP